MLIKTMSDDCYAGVNGVYISKNPSSYGYYLYVKRACDGAMDDVCIGYSYYEKDLHPARELIAKALSDGQKELNLKDHFNPGNARASSYYGCTFGEQIRKKA
jgi:hypothetical protein